MSNCKQEMMWVDGWNELSELLEDLPNAYILIVPEFRAVTLDDAREWIQNAAYKNYKTIFNLGYYQGTKSIFIQFARKTLPFRDG
jgi:hypothetical protein